MLAVSEFNKTYFLEVTLSVNPIYLNYKKKSIITSYLNQKWYNISAKKHHLELHNRVFDYFLA
jgi:hypothetical protein